jgi:hypothetical protein
MFPGRNAAAGAPAGKSSVQSTRDVRDVKADNDDTALPPAPSGLPAREVIAALRQDIAAIVTPADMPEDEQMLRHAIHAALAAKLDEYEAKEEG